MSTHDQNNQHPGPNDTANAIRNDLKATFDDNQMPVGADFARFLDATVIQGSDTLIVTDAGTTVNNALVATMDVDIDGKLTVKGQTKLDAGLSVAEKTDLNADLNVTGATVLGSTQTGNLTVSGESHTQNITADGSITSNNKLNLTSIDDKNLELSAGNIRVTDNSGDRSFVLNEDGLLGLGVNGEPTAQLHVQQKANTGDDLLKIEDATANHSGGDIHNHSYLLVDAAGKVGVGLSHPKCQLDVSSELFIGRNSVENPLTGKPRLGIKVNPGEKGFSVLNGSEEVLSITDTEFKTHANCDVTFNGDVTVGGTLDITGDADYKQSLNVEKELTVQEKTLLNDQLTVESETHLKSSLNVSGLATFSDSLNLTQDLTVSGNSSTQKLSAQQLSVGLDDYSSSAAIHVKQGIPPSLRLENSAAESQLLVDGQTITAGTPNAVIQLLVNGGVDVSQNLHVHGRLTTDNGALISGDNSRVKQTQNSQHTALEVSSKGENSTALDIRHQTSDVDSVSLFKLDHSNLELLNEDAENKTLNIGAVTTIQAATHLKDTLDVESTLSASENIMVGGGLFVEQNQQEVSLQVDGLQNESPSLIIKGDYLGIHQPNPEVDLDIMGDVKITGDLNTNGTLTVNKLLEVDEEQARILQRDDTVPIVIRSIQSNDSKDGTKGRAPAISKTGVDIAASGIAVGALLGDESLLVQGETLLVGQTEIDNLTITKQMTADAISTFNDSVSVNAKLDINTVTEDLTSDVYITASSARQRALRVDSFGATTPSLLVDGDRVGINNDAPTVALDVTGDIHVSESLRVDHDLKVTKNTDIDGDLTISGTTKAQNILSEGDIAIGVDKAAARLHIRDMNGQTQALRIDNGGNDTSFLVDQGKVALGYDKVKDAKLAVAGDVEITEELTVKGLVHFEKTLYVDEDSYFDSDIRVIKDTELNGQTIIGDINDQYDREFDENGAPLPRKRPDAQLYVSDSRYKEAFRIDSQNHASLVFAQGKLGIGSHIPRVELDIDGEMNIKGVAQFRDEIEVSGVITGRDNLQIFGSLSVSQRSEFGSDVRIRGDLRVEDRIEIEEDLTVTGPTNLNAKTTVDATLTVTDDVHLKSNTVVDGDLIAHQNIDFHGSLSNIGKPKGRNNTDRHAEPEAIIHIRNLAMKDSIRIESDDANNPKRHFTLDANGHLGLGTKTPETMLDVAGSVTIRETLNTGDVLATTIMANTLEIAESVDCQSIEIENSLRLKKGVMINDISTASDLGGMQSNDAVLATQKAIKTYIDKHKSGLNNIGEVITVSNQKEFDRIFNLGEGTTIEAQTAILLLPLYSGYKLHNSVTLKSNVSISGFNGNATRIIKQKGSVHFDLVGEKSMPITGVELSGFSFDGGDLVMNDDGGAFFLQNVRDCKLNCIIERHRCRGNGGAIYAANAQGANDGVCNIEALHIRHCHVESTDSHNGRGGAVYGLYRSKVVASDCSAGRGGAIAYCRACVVKATNCKAAMHGGAAYRCEQLRLESYSCKTDKNGKGGGAYYCTDLIAEGMWMDNEADTGMNIYAQSELNAEHESFYWKGDYIGRRLQQDCGVWQNFNI